MYLTTTESKRFNSHKSAGQLLVGLRSGFGCFAEYRGFPLVFSWMQM